MDGGGGGGGGDGAAAGIVAAATDAATMRSEASSAVAVDRCLSSVSAVPFPANIRFVAVAAQQQQC